MMFVRWIGWAALALTLAGCAMARVPAARPAPTFDFQRDVFAYPNELAWQYSTDPATGHVTAHRPQVRPEYTLHCFVMVRAARQFFAHARFDPAQPRASEAEYRQRLRAVMRRSARRSSTPASRIVIPGYAGLRDFSAAQEKLLQAECGGAWRSYFQRGHWRMIFPFSRRHQAVTATRLRQTLETRGPPAVHVVRFPALTINHGLLVFAAEDAPGEIRFRAYDPNAPEAPTELRFDRATRTFSLPRHTYFAGGRVDVYEIFVDACH